MTSRCKPNSIVTAKTLPAGTGVVSSYAYDAADRLTGIAHVKDGQTTLASVSYTLDAVGNRTGRVDEQGTHSYSYDGLYRLTSVTYPGPSTTSYSFDPFGNRTSMTNSAGTTTYACDDAGRLTEVQPPSPAPAIGYDWDDNGNLTERGSDTFAWDYEDRMVSATVNSVTTTFAYRGDGLRDSRTVGMTTTTFTWDINASLPVVLDDGSRYVYGAGLESMVTASGSYYYLADGLGSTMAIVDSAGTVQKSYTYDVYGKPTATGTLANEFDFAAQQTDPTGLQYLRARYMDPETGRFVSREPLETTPGWTGNGYGYAGANPTRFLDPSGKTLTEGEAGTNHCRHECTVDFDYEGGAWESERPTIGEYATRKILESACWLLVGDALRCAFHKAMKACAENTTCRALIDEVVSGGGTLEDIADALAPLGIGGRALGEILDSEALKGGGTAIVAFGLEWRLYRWVYTP